MHPYFINYATSAFWSDVAARLLPLIGDVETTLGFYWMDEFERCFTRADFLVITMARRLRGKVPDWYVLQWHGASGRICGDEDDWLVAGESRDACLAHLLGRCNQFDVWPTSFDYAADRDRTVFTREGETFAVLRPIGKPASIDPATRSRVEGTLVGLRKHEDPVGEFAKRLSRWPGLAGVCSNGDSYGQNKGSVHWPCPKEWLQSARLLWAKAGKGEPTTAQSQALAAAALGFASWHHLCGLLPSSSSCSDWLSLYSAYYVHEVDASDHETIALYQDPVEAFLDFRSRVEKACAKFGALQAEMYMSIPRVPNLWVRRPPREGVSLLTQLDEMQPLVSMSAVNQADFDDTALDRVKCEMQDGYVEGLQRLLVPSSWPTSI